MLRASLMSILFCILILSFLLSSFFTIKKKNFLLLLKFDLFKFLNKKFQYFNFILFFKIFKFLLIKNHIIVLCFNCTNLFEHHILNPGLKLKLNEAI